MLLTRYTVHKREGNGKRTAGEGKILDNGKRNKMSVKKNDEVIYAKYLGNEVEIDREKYVILRESDILGIVEK